MINDTGEPIAVLNFCLYIVLQKVTYAVVATNLVSAMMSSTVRLVQKLRLVSLDRRPFITDSVSSIWVLVNSDTTSCELKMSYGSMITFLSLSAKWLEFLV